MEALIRNQSTPATQWTYEETWQWLKNEDTIFMRNMPSTLLINTDEERECIQKMMESMTQSQWNSFRALIDENILANNSFHEYFNLSRNENIRMRSLLLAIGDEYLLPLLEQIKTRLRPSGPRVARRLVFDIIIKFCEIIIAISQNQIKKTSSRGVKCHPKMN